LDVRTAGIAWQSRLISTTFRRTAVDQAAFRAKLSGVYALWKEKLGSKCWSLAEAEVGKLG
jgi:hypothetical protein